MTNFMSFYYFMLAGTNLIRRHDFTYVIFNLIAKNEKSAQYRLYFARYLPLQPPGANKVIYIFREQCFVIL